MLSVSLKPFSLLFGAIVRCRYALYAKGLYQAQDLHKPTISVGNITVGGTGKTPLVALVAKIIAENGRKPGVLTRGYKRENPNERVLVSDGKNILTDAKKSGDEPFELAQKLLGISAVIADKKRFQAGVWARENLACDAFVLDDGFQHLQLKRDLDIVLIDATNPFGNGNLLPVGILREPLKNLNRADLIIITRADLVADTSTLKAQISKFNQDAPILSAQTSICAITNLADFLKFPAKTQRSPSKEESKIQNPKSKIALAFCALGNPENFYASLRRETIDLKAVKSFPDHHAYTQKDIFEIEETAKKTGAEILFTTAKDAVKLGELKFHLPCLVVEIEPVLDDEKRLREIISKVVSGEFSKSEP